MKQSWTRKVAAIVLGAVMIWIGITHFRSPAPFVSIVPTILPDKLAIIKISGFFEVLGGIGLFVPLARQPAAIGLIALYIAVFPANINMALHQIPIDGVHFAAWILWLRLPMQLVLIGWAYWCADLGSIRRKQTAGKPVISGE
jgi:uncharacterized membrane protein